MALRSEVPVLDRELLDARLHMAAELYYLVFGWQKVEVYLHFAEFLFLSLVLDSLLESSQTVFTRPVIVSQLQEVFLQLLNHRNGLFLVLETVAFLTIRPVSVSNEVLHILQFFRQLRLGH